VNGDQPAG